MLLSLDYKEFQIAEGVTIEMRSLDVWAYQAVLPVVSSAFSSKAESEEDQVISGINQLSNEKIGKVIEKVFPTHLKNLKGISIEENGTIRSATVDDLVKYGAFMSICFQILVQLVTISSLSNADATSIKK